MSRVQASVNICIDDLALSVRSLDLGSTDLLDRFLAAEFSIEVLCQYEVFPQDFESAFECPFEHFGLWKATSLGDFSNPVGNFGGHAV